MSARDWKSKAKPATYSAPKAPGDAVAGSLGTTQEGGRVLTLPYPPSLNAIWRSIVVGRRARVVLSRAGRAYRANVHAQLDLLGMGAPLTGALVVALRVYRPRRIGDLDNAAKAVLDALKGRAFEDDSQVVRLLMERFDDAENPRVEVEIREVQR